MSSVALIASIYLAIVWLITFFAFWKDKQSARKKTTRRISERTLLQLSLIGGWPAALVARHLFRHKTVKQPFSTYLNITMIVETIILIVILVYYIRGVLRM